MNNECANSTYLLVEGLSRLFWTPLKLIPPGTNFWTHSEKFVPTVDRLHQRQICACQHEVTTKDISSVHSGISRKLSDWFSSVCLGWPYAALTKIILRAIEGSVWYEACTLCAAKLTGLNSFQKPQQRS